MNLYENIIIFNKYQIKQKINEGPVFSTYLGRDVDTGDNVHIKILNPDKYTRYEVDKLLFVSETKIVKTFEHENILRVLEAGSYSNTIAIVSEYLENGTSLRSFLRPRGALNLDDALDIIYQLALAVRYAHSKNILHRNIKTANICITGDEHCYHVRLFDFGVSYAIDYSSTTSDLVDEDFGFLAPEVTGLLDRKVDARSDLYSLGILFYRFVTGNFPFHADSVDNMVYQHVAVTPKNPSAFNPAIPDSVSKLIMKLLSKDPELRYQTANELINDLDVLKSSDLEGLHMHDADILQSMDQRSKLFSRKHELALIRNQYTKALESPGRFCLVSGSLGSGKSDLFANLCNELTSSDICFFRAHFSAQSLVAPYHAFHDILEDFVVRFEHYDRKLQLTEKSRLARTLFGLSSLAFSICPDMKRVLPDSLALPSLDGYREQQRSVSLLANFFLSLNAQEKPFVIILDDLHYADAASLSLLKEIAGIISNYKVFIVCSCRLDSVEEGSYLDTFLKSINSNELYENIELKPFTEARMCEYLSDLLVLDKFECQVLATYMLDKTGGNPYFTVNVLRSMLEDGIISVNKGILEQDWERLRTLNGTTDVYQIISKRLERLSEDTVSVLEIASVIGDTFDLRLIEIITDVPMDSLRDMLESAINLQFIEYASTDSVLCFANKDIHTCFIERVDELRAKSLHYWIAKALEAASVNIHKDIYNLVYHFDAAGADVELRKYIMEAACFARCSYANDEALLFYRKAVLLLEAEGNAQTEEWFIATEAIIELDLDVGNYEDAINTANMLMPLLDDTVKKAELLLKVAIGHYRKSDYTACEQYLLSSLSCLGIKLPLKEFSLKMHNKLLYLQRMVTSKLVLDPTAGIRKDKGDDRIKRLIVSIYEALCMLYAYSDSRKFNYVAMKLYNYAYKHFKSSRELATALSTLSVYYMLNNNNKLAEESQMLSLKLRGSLNDEYGIAKSKLYSGMIAQWRSDAEKSVKLFNEALQGFIAVGDQWEINNTNIYLAFSYLLQGNYRDCEKLARECIKTSERLGDRLALCMAYSHLISCYTETGDLTNAEDVANRCRLLIDSFDMPYAQAMYSLAHGKLLMNQKRYEDAELLLTKAKDLIENNNLSPVHLFSAYGYLAITKIRLLEKNRSSLELSEVQHQEYEINAYCERAVKFSRSNPLHTMVAHRAYALLGIITEKYKITDRAYEFAAHNISNNGYRYECAMLDYEYGQYLLTKHRTDEARFYIFEAYMTFSNIMSVTYQKICENIIASKFREDFSNTSMLTDVALRRNRLNVDRKVNTLLRLGDRLTSTLELNELQNKILQDAVELVGAERGILFLYPETGEKKLYVASVYNLGSFDGNTYDWMLEEIEAKRKPIVINDLQSDEYRKHYSIIVRHGIKSVMAMPMFVHGNLFGVIYLDSRLVREIFTEDYVEAMGFIANQAGAPLENARLYQRAITDGLTGIYGRSYLDNLIIDLTSVPDTKLSAIMIDVDNFKRFNDTYGHPFGDKVLKHIAGIMKRISGEGGICCRYGGEEFVVILDSNDSDYVTSIAEKICRAVEAASIACNDGENVSLVSITISLGVSIWVPGMERIDLIEHADKALYYAKNHGKNQVVLWSKELEV